MFSEMTMFKEVKRIGQRKHYLLPQLYDHNHLDISDYLVHFNSYSILLFVCWCKN